jgi:hypothetical protein
MFEGPPPNSEGFPPDSQSPPGGFGGLTPTMEIKLVYCQSSAATFPGFGVKSEPKMANWPAAIII